MNQIDQFFFNIFCLWCALSHLHVFSAQNFFMFGFIFMLRQNYLFFRNWLWFQPVRTLNTKIADKPPAVLVASIGNPETSQFNNTRHNVGHWVLNELVHNGQFGSFSKSSLPHGDTSASQNVWLYKCNSTYMNISGPPVTTAWNKFKELQSQASSPALVVICDDTRVPFGKILVRPQGSSPRGHNGLKSLDLGLGKMYTRIAVGVGSPIGSGDKDIMADFVLSELSDEDIKVLRELVVPEVSQLIEKMRKGKYVYDVFQAPTPKRRRPA